MDIEISDAVCLAALRGWCGWAPDAPLSGYQQSDETKKAWRRAILAALNELNRSRCPGPLSLTAESFDLDTWQPAETGCG